MSHLTLELTDVLEFAYWVYQVRDRDGQPIITLSSNRDARRFISNFLPAGGKIVPLEVFRYKRPKK